MKLLTRFWDLSHAFQRCWGRICVSRDAAHVCPTCGADAQGRWAWRIHPAGPTQSWGISHQPKSCAGSLEGEEKGEAGEDLLYLAKEREGAMNEKSAGPLRGRQGAPGLFPPPFCQGLLLDETFKSALPHPSRPFSKPLRKAGTCAAASATRPWLRIEPLAW